MGAHLSLFWPGIDGLWSVAAALIVFAAATVIGSAVGGRRLAGAAPVAGWGLAAGAITLLGTLSRLPLYAWGLAIAGLALLILTRRWRGKAPSAAGRHWRVLVLITPMLLLVAGSGFTNWDDFTHWLPNAGYLFRFDSFPRADLPKSPSVWPAYPYGLVLWSYFIDLISGRFVERAGALANVLLIGGFAGVLAQLLAEGRPRPSGAADRWADAALGLLAATALNPGFAPSFAITAWSDSATSVAFGATGVIGWRLLENLREEDGSAAKSLALQFGCAAMALVNLRQANPVLLALLVAGMGLVALRDPKVRIVRLLPLMVPMLLPPLVLVLAWRHYVAANIPVGEFQFLPIAQWRLGELPEILAGAFRQSLPKAFYYEMAGLSLFGLVGLLQPTTALRRLAVLVAVVFTGYSGFLLFAYVAANFPPVEALRAASFWRYSTHTALFGMAALVLIAQEFWDRWRSPLRERLARWGAWLALAAPLAVLVAPHALVRPVRPEEAFIRGIGRELAETLPPGTRIGAALPDALVVYMLNYELLRLGRDDRGLRAWMYVADSLGEAERARRLADLIADPELRYTFTLGRYREGVEALGNDLAPGEAGLFERAEAGWRLVKRWKP